MRMEEGAFQWALVAREASWRRRKWNGTWKRGKEPGEDRGLELGVGRWDSLSLTRGRQGRMFSTEGPERVQGAATKPMTGRPWGFLGPARTTHQSSLGAHQKNLKKSTYWQSAGPQMLFTTRSVILIRAQIKRWVVYIMSFILVCLCTYNFLIAIDTRFQFSAVCILAF